MFSSLRTPSPASHVPQHVENPAVGSSQANANPSHTALPANASPSDLIARCNRLLDDLKINTMQHEQRVQTMQLLAQQLPHLPGEKSVAGKVKEVAVRAGALAVNGVWSDLVPSQKQLRKQHRTPQAAVFYGLMDHLADARRLNRPSTARFLGFKKATPSPGPASFFAPEIDRRRLNAPVWSQLILDAHELKDGRQAKMLKGFEANFNDLPVQGSESEMKIVTGMIDAYSESFTNLVRTLARPNTESHSNTLSKQEAKALDILGKFAVRLSGPVREQLLHEVRNASNSASSGSRPALSTALAGLTDTLTTASAGHPNQAEAVTSEAAANSPVKNRTHSLRELEKALNESQGSVSDMVKHMTSVVERLPTLSNKPLSASQPSIRANAFQLVIRHLDAPNNPHKAETTMLSRLSLQKRELKFDGNDIPRRTSVAPVWTALFSKVDALTPVQKDMLLARFAENFQVFDLLSPQESENWNNEKQKLLAAYVPSLTKLLEMLPNLGDAKRSASMNGTQQDAIRILREYAVQLPAEGKNALSKTIDNVVSTLEEGKNSIHPVILQLTHFKKDLEHV